MCDAGNPIPLAASVLLGAMFAQRGNTNPFPLAASPILQGGKAPDQAAVRAKPTGNVVPAGGGGGGAPAGGNTLLTGPGGADALGALIGRNTALGS